VKFTGGGFQGSFGKVKKAPNDETFLKFNPAFYAVLAGDGDYTL
jgi:hypothetical protein